MIGWKCFRCGEQITDPKFPFFPPWEVHHSDSTSICWGNWLLLASFSVSDLPWGPDLYTSCVLVLPLLVFLIFQQDSVPEMCPPTRVRGCLEGRKEPASTAGFVVRSVGDQKQRLRCLRSRLMKWKGAILAWTENVPSILFEKWNACPGKKKKSVIKSIWWYIFEKRASLEIHIYTFCALRVNGANYLIIWSGGIKTPFGVPFLPYARGSVWCLLCDRGEELTGFSSH